MSKFAIGIGIAFFAMSFAVLGTATGVMMWRSSNSGGSTLLFEGTTSGGGYISSTGYEGKIVVLDFWATWCPPCVQAVPEMAELQRTYPDRVQVVGISGDRSLAPLVKFENDRNLPYPSIYGGADSLFDQYDVSLLPTVIIFDETGKQVYRGHHGAKSEVLKLL